MSPRPIPEPLSLRPSLSTLAALLCLAVMAGCEDETAGPDPTCVTAVEADIELATTWGGECSTIEVLSSILVDAPLTVLPGTTVRADQGVHIGVRVDGSLNARGRQSAPIVFEGIVAQPGFWSGISIASADAANQLEWVEIWHTGASGGRLFHGNVDAALVVLGPAQQSMGKVLLTNTLLTEGSEIGLKVVDGGDISGSTNLSIEHMGGDAIAIAFSDIGQLDGSFRAVGNGGFFKVTRGDLVTRAVVPSLEAPLVMQGQIRIRDGGHLIVEGGNEVRFEQDVLLSTSSGGRMSFDGTEENGIALIGDEGIPGYWAGLVFESFSDDNRISHATIADAGAPGWLSRQAAVVVTGQSTSRGMLTVEESTFIDITGHGIEVLEGGELTESGNSFDNVTGSNIEDHNP